MIDRRHFLKCAAATAGLAAAGFSGSALAQAGLKTGARAPFSFDALKRRARDTARAPYAAPPRSSPEILNQIDYDAHGKIKFKTDLALWAEGPSEFPVTFFHLGRFFQKPVRMHVVEGGQAREIIYDNAYFDMPADSPAHRLPDNSGFAGFRFQEAAPRQARLAEERLGRLSRRLLFPGDRRAFPVWPFGAGSCGRRRGLRQERGIPGLHPRLFRDAAIRVGHRDGSMPSSTGRASTVPSASSCAAAPPSSWTSRRPSSCARMSLASASRRLPRCTGISEKAKHDGHRLAAGDPRFRRLGAMDGFGRAHLAAAQQPAAHHHVGLRRRAPERLRAAPARPQLRPLPRRRLLRPAAVPLDRADERLGQGRGPARRNPDRRRDPRQHRRDVGPGRACPGGPVLRVRISDRTGPPTNPSRPRSPAASRRGSAMAARPARLRPKGVRKFMVEFKGEPLTRLAKGVIPQPILWSSRGEFSNLLTEAVPNDVPGHWRTQFDLTVTGTDPVEMRCFLRNGDRNSQRDLALPVPPGALSGIRRGRHCRKIRPAVNICISPLEREAFPLY